MANGWLTDTLILLPLGGAIFIAISPLPRLAAGLVALAVSLVEIAFWGGALTAFDYGPGAGTVQLQDTTTWFGDLGISYHVGFTGFALWLVGMSSIAMTAAIAYAVWVGRQHARAYFASMLLLTAAVVGVFAAQDYLLFYVFWEAMLIPLYVLVGVWGGPGRLRATLVFFIYTMAGSLLMLASIIVLGISHGSFDMVGPGGVSNSNWIFLGFVAAFFVKAPIFPFHGWLPLAYREAPAEVAGVLSGVVSKAAAYGLLYVAVLHFPGPSHDFRTPILVLAAIGLIYGSLLAFRAPDFRGVVAYSSLAQLGLITLGLFATNIAGFNGAVLQMVNHGFISLGLFMLAGLVELRTGTGRFERLGGMAKGRPVLATVLMTLGIIALAVPGSSAFGGEFLVLTGVFRSGWGWSVVGAIAMVLAAMYMLRLISAVLHQSRGSAVTDAARDLGLPELAFLAPLVVLLIFLSVWPAAITDHTFGQRSSTPGLTRLAVSARAAQRENLKIASRELFQYLKTHSGTTGGSIVLQVHSFSRRVDNSVLALIPGQFHVP